MLADVASFFHVVDVKAHVVLLIGRACRASKARSVVACGGVLVVGRTLKDDGEAGTELHKVEHPVAVLVKRIEDPHL